MFRVASAVLFFLLMFASDLNGQAKRLTKLSSPQPDVVEGFAKGHCVVVSNDIRICKQLSDAEDAFVVEKRKRVFGRWPTSAYLGETSDFEVLSGDLNGDGRSELIISNHDSTSVGIGVNYWTISIFPDAEFVQFVPPLTFSVEEYGTKGTFVELRDGISILTTEWLSLTDPKGKRGQGLYLAGQWWRYESGQLRPAHNRPTVIRRYLLSFERQRLASMDSPNVPYQWLTNSDAIPVKRDLDHEEASEARVGVVEAVTLSSDTRQAGTLTIRFKADNQESVTYVYPKDEGTNELRYFCDGPSGRRYPKNYLPSSPEAWLRGKRATVRTFRENQNAEPFKVLCLER